MSIFSDSGIFTGCFARAVKARIESIEILFIKLFLDRTECFTEPLEMHDFSFSQEFERLTNIRVVDQAEKVVVGCSGFLLWHDGIRTTFRGDLYKLFPKI